MKANIILDLQKTETPEMIVTACQIISTAIIGLAPRTEKTEVDFYTNRDLGDENPSDIFEA